MSTANMDQYRNICPGMNWLEGKFQGIGDNDS